MYSIGSYVRNTNPEQMANAFYDQLGGWTHSMIAIPISFDIIRKSICVLIAPDLCLDHDRCNGDVGFYTISTSCDEERLGVGWVCEPCLDGLPQRGLDCPIIAKVSHVVFALEALLNDVEELQGL